MNFPSILLGLVIAILLGALFFLIRPAGSYRRFGLCLLASCAGFAAGQLFAMIAGLNFLDAGAIHLAGAVPGSILAMLGLQIFALKEWK